MQLIEHKPATALVFEQQPRESNKAFAAFKTYLELGAERSLATAADKLGKSKRMMEKWSRKFDWPARVQAHTAHLADIERKSAEAVAVKNGVDWAARQQEHREDEWQTRSELIALAREAIERAGPMVKRVGLGLRANIGRKRLTISATRAAVSSFGNPARFRPNAILPSTVRCGNSA